MENNTARNRLDDMLERYGEVCTQKVARPTAERGAAHHSPACWRKGACAGSTAG